MARGRFVNLQKRGLAVTISRDAIRPQISKMGERSSKMKSILILEDNQARAALLRHAVAELGPGYSARIWSDAPSMRAECEAYFPTAALISLDHDLTPPPCAKVDPGTGMDIVRFLGEFPPVCPVIVHSQNMELVWRMHNELRFAGWEVRRARRLKLKPRPTRRASPI
jgi:hypothetical protein